jgi:phosphate:Na+ symporter
MSLVETNNALLIILHIAGAAALLIWSVRLVRTGVERAFAVQLRRWLRLSSNSKLLAAASGMGSAVLLQSSTAVAILVSNLVSRGSAAAAVGLAILLGADAGSAIAAQLLLLKQSFIVPLLMLVGVGLFLRGQTRKTRQVGRILIGLSLVFVSLDLIRAATSPLTHSQNAEAIMGYLSKDMVTAFIVGAIFAWVVHSSVAAILLFVTLVAHGVLSLNAAVALVLGANMGSTFIAYVLTLATPIEARRMIVANVALRGGGAILALGVLMSFDVPLTWLGQTPASQVIGLHLAFNIGLALVSLPLIGPVLALVTKFMRPTIDPSTGNGRASPLDPAALTRPDRALSCAAREIMHMAEAVEGMMRIVSGLFVQWDDTVASTMLAEEKKIRKMHLEIKLYLAKLNQAEMDETTSTKSMELSTTAASMWGAAETISPKLVGLARRLDIEGVTFSDQGMKEVSDFHDHVLSNAQLAIHVMMVQDPEEARALFEKKDEIRDIERRLQHQHLKRLQEGLVESIETSNIHQETLRALKQVNAFFTVIANPLLSETGDLLSSRLASRPSS